MKTLLILLLLPVALLCSAQLPQKAIEVDLPKMYQEVDEAIEQSPKFVHQYEESIDQAKQNYREAESDDQRLLLLLQISKLYEGFNGDSALAYSLRCMEDARKLGLADVEADYQARSAYLCTFLGSQTEALTLLGSIDRFKLSSEGVGIYFRAYLTAYEMLADHCKTPELQKSFRRQYYAYRDSLLRAVPEESELYYFYREDQLIKEGKLQQALKMNDQRLNQATPDSHDDAIIAYSRYRIYQKQGNRQLALYWLCRSALADIRNSVMDQMSLISLAQELDADGDFERASRYISYTWESNRKFSPNMRSWQIAPLLSAIENNFQRKLDQQRHRFYLYTICSSSLVLLLIIIILYGRDQRKKTTPHREEE